MYLAGGVALLVGGGEGVVRGGAALAHRLGVRPLLVGLTVVAVATSGPELAVSVAAAAAGRGAIAFGTVVGSNLANLALVLGMLALARPVPVERPMIRGELPALLAITLLAAALLHPFPGGAAPGYERADGVVLLVAFAGFLATWAARARGERRMSAARAGVPPIGVRRALLALGLGCAGLAAGAELAVRGAVGLAADLGISEELVALAVLALGTSLPELATSATALRRGSSELALGNVVGSCVANLGLVLGVAVLAGPFALPEGGGADLAAASFLAALVFALGAGGAIARPAGALLVVLYAAYIAWRAGVLGPA